jgi:hypothetical protein
MVQRGLQSLVVLFVLVTSSRENLRSFGLEMLVPLVDLGGMPPDMTDQLVDGFVPLEGFKRHSGFECGAVVIPLYRHIAAPSD